MDFITDAEVASFLGVAVDAKLTRIRKAVEADFMRACGREFLREARTVYLAGFGPNLDYAFLPEWPVHSITDIRIDVTGAFEAGTAVDDLTDFVTDGAKLTYLGGWFPEGSRVVMMTGEFGYYAQSDAEASHADGKPPEDLRDGLIEEVVARYRRGASEQMQSENVSGIGGYTRFAAGRTEGFKRVIRRYRKVT